MKKLMLLFSLLLALALPPIAEAQDGYWPVTGPQLLKGGSDGDLLISTSLITLSEMDSVQFSFEYQDSTWTRILAAAVHTGLTTAAADTVKDTVLVKTVNKTGPGVTGITFQELIQAFGGAVPPQFKLYIFFDKDGTAIASRAKKAAMTEREFTRR